MSEYLLDASRRLEPRDYQRVAIDDLRAGLAAGHKRQILALPTGSGKCLGLGTTVMMADGSIRPVEDIGAGDRVMGPDGTPRTVLSANSGRGHLVRIVPLGGEPWVCNTDHVLTLVRLMTGATVDVPFRDWIRWSGPKKHCHTMYRVPSDFSANKLPVYFTAADLGIGDYYGFTLDGDGRFLLGDRTVTHNTETAAYLIKKGLEKKSGSMFVADRLVLVDQASERLAGYGIPHGRIQAGTTGGRSRLVQVASAQTLEKRDDWGNPDILIIDECHDQRKAVLEWAREWDGPVIGLTATPLTQGLGKFYSRIVSPVTTNELIRSRHLVPVRFIAGREIDMTGEPAGNLGEWTSSSVRRRGSAIIGDIVTEWRRWTHKSEEDGGFGGPVQTLVFSADVEHGKQLCDAFRAAGYDFRQTTYADSLDKTRSMISAFRSGEFTGLLSVQKLSRGFDVPEVKCLVGARPYRTSLAAFLQQLGRGMRPSEGKDHCLYLDHAGNVEGWWDEVQSFWAHSTSKLPPDRRPKKQVRQEGEERPDIVCACGVVLPPRVRECPLCGETKPTPERSRSRSRTVPGVMREIKAGDADWMADRGWLWIETCTVISRWTDDEDKRTKLARIHYKEMTGAWPPWELPFSPRQGWPDHRVKTRIQRQSQAYFRRKREAAV